MLEQQSQLSELLSDLERQVCDPLLCEVVLDLAETQVISSFFINELIRVSLRLRMTDRRLLLINVQPSVCEVLKLLRLDRTFEFESIPVCDETGQASATIKQRTDPAQKARTFFLRRFASRFALRSFS